MSYLIQKMLVLSISEWSQIWQIHKPLVLTRATSSAGVTAVTTRTRRSPRAICAVAVRRWTGAAGGTSATRRVVQDRCWRDLCLCFVFGVFLLPVPVGR